MFAFNHQTGEKLTLVRNIQDNVYVALDANKRRWIVKWEVGPGNVVPLKNPEVAEYNRLEKMGAQVPQRLHGYKVNDFEVLVLEFLDPIDETDDVLVMATQLISTQLRYIHRYACHGDIKIDNIRKRGNLYFLIDLNLSKIPYGTGYKRMHFTPLFASQQRPPYDDAVVMITYKNDLLELVYVMHALLCKAKKSMDSEPKHDYGLEPDDYFADPISMSKHSIGKTARGWRAIRQLLEFGLREHYFITGNLLQNIDEPNYDILLSYLNDDLAIRTYETYKRENMKDPNCIVCSAITNVKCGYCYHITSPLCSNIACLQQHKCVWHLSFYCISINIQKHIDINVLIGIVKFVPQDIEAVA